MERAMNYNYRLLSKEQVFGETKIDVIRFLQEYRNNRFLLISTHQKEDVELLKGILITL